jgi:hypothetical protein
MVPKRIPDLISKLRSRFATGGIFSGGLEKRVKGVTSSIMLSIVVEAGSEPGQVALKESLLMCHKNSRFVR